MRYHRYWTYDRACGLFSGAPLLTLGLVGAYLGRFCLAINMTPQAVVRKTWGLGAPASGGDDA